jgi:hypothetical protein
MKNLLQKLLKIQGLAVKKDANNPFYHSKYSSLDGIMESLNPLLQENKLVLSHTVKNREVNTTLYDSESEDRIESSISIPELTDPQKMGSAITYFKRYNIGCIFNIITDEDDDGNATITQAKPAKVYAKNVAPSKDPTNCKKCGKVLNDYKLIAYNGKDYKVYACDTCMNPKKPTEFLSTWEEVNIDNYKK